MVIFGSKSERFVAASSGQLGLFEEPVAELESKTEKIQYTREKKTIKKQPVRIPLAAHLPRVEEIIEPENLPEGAKRIGQQVTEIQEYNPAKIYVRRIVRPKYVLTEQSTITTAELPSLPLAKSNAGPSLLAHIMVSKFIDHLPFYRKIQIFKSQQLTLSDSTISGWFNATTDLLIPLYDVLKKQLLKSDYLQADESPIGVQDSHKKGSLHTGYQWVYRAPAEGLVLFKYHPSRSKKAPQEVLKNFSGTLQTDGYKVYQDLQTQGTITLLGCMAHARRYFEKALDNDHKRASHVLKQIQRLYTMERKLKDRNSCDHVKKRYRGLYARPVLMDLKSWLDSNSIQVLPKSAIGKAMTYTIKLWPKLTAYINHGKYQIDNNLIENAIRPLALGRKNYLFAGSHKAAQKAAMFYSFFATCKINNVEPLS